MLYDTHAHIDSYEFPEDYQEVARRALDSGVIFNNVGTNKQTSQEALRVARLFDSGVYASVGLHPDLVIEGYKKNGNMLLAEPQFDYDFYKALASDSRVVGIGECGLDYYLKEDLDLATVKKSQTQAFLPQLELARELDKVLIIHCRPSKNSDDAYEDMLKLLRSKERELPRFLVHSFTSSWDIARRFVSLGGYIGLNGIITFDKTGLLKEVIENCPRERLLLETDAPYLAPVPVRGKKNEPRFVRHTAEFLAAQKGLPVAEIESATFRNSIKLFKLSSLAAI